MSKIINIAKDFSRYPYGRLRKFSNSSGEEFRDKFLVKALSSGQDITIVLDGTEGYGSSFLEEAFGGLARNAGLNKEALLNKIKFISIDDPSLIDEIRSYINKA